MGVVAVSSSAAQSPQGLSRQFSHQRSVSGRPLIVAFKSNKSNNTALVALSEQALVPVETSRKHRKRQGKVKKVSKHVRGVFTEEASPCSLELDYNEAAAKLKNIYKLSPATKISDLEDVEGTGGRKSSPEGNRKADNSINQTVVRNQNRRTKRLSLDKRVALKKNKDAKIVAFFQKKKDGESESEKIDRLFRDYSTSTDLVSLDWKRMKIPPVLTSMKGNLQKVLGRDPTEGELAEATNMTAVEVRKHMEFGQAARNKLIKVRVEIQRAKLELSFELQRRPTEEQILEKVRISPERYQKVMKASKPVASLHSRHAVTQEEFINGITDIEGVGGDKRRQPALLRLAIDDVLDSLKPNESLVMRQRYGLDGKGDRTLGEIAGNLNISREMVRKHEVKALMKLRHPARVDYLRQYVV